MIGNVPKLTNKGVDILREQMTDGKMTFTRFAIGSGYVQGDTSGLTELSEKVIDVPISVFDNSLDGGFVRIEGSFSNTDIPNDFTWREIGIYAMGEDEIIKYVELYSNIYNELIITDKPEEILSLEFKNYDGSIIDIYNEIKSYNKDTGTIKLGPSRLTKYIVGYKTNAAVEQLYAYCCDENGELIQKGTDGVVSERVISAIVATGTVANVSADIAAQDMYALKSDFLSHKNSTSNPHSVTKSQIGLSNVVNVSPENMVPGHEFIETMSVPEQNDRMSVIVGKMRTAITNLIEHIGRTNNPHNVTKAQVGLCYVVNLAPENMMPGYDDDAAAVDIDRWDKMKTIVGKFRAWINMLAEKAHIHDNIESLNAMPTSAPEVGQMPVAGANGRFENVYGNTFYGQYADLQYFHVGYTKSGEKVYRGNLQIGSNYGEHGSNIGYRLYHSSYYNANKILNIFGTFQPYTNQSDPNSNNYEISNVVYEINTFISGSKYVYAYICDGDGTLKYGSSMKGMYNIYFDFTRK